MGQDEGPRDFMTTVVHEAASVAVGYFRSASLQTRYKIGTDPVTEADLAAERLLLERIRDAYPNDAILSEESGASGEAGRRWLVDPVDGTRNFRRGLRPWGTILGLEIDGAVRHCAFYDPGTDELLYASAEGGTELNGMSLPARIAPPLDRAMVHAYPVDDLSYEITTRLWPRVERVRAFGCGGRAYADLALGGFDVVVDTDTTPWDSAPRLLGEAVGCCSATLTGEPFTGTEPTIVTAASRELLDGVLAVLAPLGHA